MTYCILEKINQWEKETRNRHSDAAFGTTSRKLVQCSMFCLKRQPIKLKKTICPCTQSTDLILEGVKQIFTSREPFPLNTLIKAWMSRSFSCMISFCRSISSLATLRFSSANSFCFLKKKNYTLWNLDYQRESPPPPPQTEESKAKPQSNELTKGPPELVLYFRL